MNLGRALQSGIGILSSSGALLLSFLMACSLPPTIAKIPSPPSPIVATQAGIASWYGPGFHGRPTASGVIYDQHELTAAHQTLPLGTRVMVTNLNNKRSVEVSINDRGPFLKGRIIDLSYAAAQSLGMIRPGTIPVRIEVIDSGPHRIQTIPESLDYTLQVGSFAEVENARRLKDQLVNSYPQIPEVLIVPVHGKDTTYHRVQLGTFNDRRDAEAHAQRLARLGLPVIILEK
ncbi:MAG: septal ring lytic transglycosylase RlpA family protein [Deltaproteobacteria bacterium]|nr:septal ring lytic transglycosylase RlpA family protein [Deltaproteobacteria bacterium]